MEPTVELKAGRQHVRVTMTATRISLKVPAEADPAYLDRLKAFVTYVFEQVGAPPQSLRGKVWETQGMLMTSLYTVSRAWFGTYKELKA